MGVVGVTNLYRIATRALVPSLVSRNHTEMEIWCEHGGVVVTGLKAEYN